MQQKFDVFLNFRGEDVRYSFLSHLLGALNQASLQIFVDYEIKRGDDISLALMSAIENSKLAITIFSKNYATSRWCLDELVKIMECCTENSRIEQMVIPVYYHVTASQVKNQSESFAEAFTDHETSEDLENRRKVPIWKGAMKRAGGIAGRSVEEKRPEYAVVVEIVNDVLKAFGRPPMEYNVDDSCSCVKLIHTLEFQVKGKMWTPSSSLSSEGIRIDLDSFLNMFKLHAHLSSSPSLEWNPQTYSSNSQASKHGQSEGSKDTDTSSGPSTKWKGGQSEGSKSTEISSASAQKISYRTEELYLPDVRDKVLLFVISSPGIVARCEAVRKVLKSYGVSFDERNTSMSSHRKELEDVLNGKPVQFPALFVKGYFIGGYTEIMKFKKSGKLAEILQDLSARNRTLSCDHNRKKETETRPLSNAKVVPNTDLGMAKPEGSKSKGKSSAFVQNTLYFRTEELYFPDASDKVVLFVISSPGIVARCGAVREVLKGYGVSFDERNTSIAWHRKELEDVLNGKLVQFPALFVKGYFIGGYEEIMKFKQSGKLAEILQDLSARNRTLSLDHNRKKETETRPSSNAKAMPNTDLRMAKLEGSKSIGKSDLRTEELYLPNAGDKVVLFVISSPGIVARCDAVRVVLKGYGIYFDERNTSIAWHRKGLEDVLNGKPVQFPALFVKGYFIGGYEEIMKFKQSGKLAEILQDFSARNRIFCKK